MIYTPVRILPILVSGIAFMMVGGLWYGPLFAKAWLQLIGKTDAEVRAAAKPTMYLGSFVAALVASYLLFVFIETTGMVTAKGGMCVGLAAAIGFVGTSFASSYLFNHKPVKLYLIDVGYQVVCFVIAGAIIGGWR